MNFWGLIIKVVVTLRGKDKKMNEIRENVPYGVNHKIIVQNRFLTIRIKKYYYYYAVECLLRFGLQNVSSTLFSPRFHCRGQFGDENSPAPLDMTESDELDRIGGNCDAVQWFSTRV